MAKVTVETPDGKTYNLVHAYGLTYETRVLSQFEDGDLKSHVESVLDLDIRDDDVYLAAFPKCGTHWVWEILVMLRKGKAEYEVKTKEAVFLDFRSSKEISDFPSPRILNCHYPPKLMPTGIVKKKIKIVHVMRNPKDTFVSFYHHLTWFSGGKMGSIGDFLPRLLGEYGFYQLYSWCQYMIEWERFSKKHPEQILNIFYEDIKEDPITEIKKINEFLGTGRDDNLIAEIADVCGFDKMKKANATMKEFGGKSDQPVRLETFYRKGQVGDWKNHFTVAQNEAIDKWLDENFSDSKLTFRYTL